MIDVRSVGTEPISFSADQDGEIAVAAACVDSPHYPPCRVWLAAGRPSLKSTGDDAVIAALTVDQVDELISRLKTAKVMVLGAAERQTVLEHDGAVLVRSSLGAWGAGDGADGVIWYADEAQARDAYHDIAGVRPCAGCTEMFDEDQLREAGEDGPRLCPPCYEADLADWNATRVVHEDEAHQATCSWRGTVGQCEVEDNGATLACPVCAEVVVTEDDAPLLELDGPGPEAAGG